MQYPEIDAGRQRRRLRGSELFVELPLQPAMKVDGVGVFSRELNDRRVRRMLQRLRPLVPVAAVDLGQCAPRGEIVEAVALASAVCGVRELAAGRRCTR